jgi:hypothetical protein
MASIRTAKQTAHVEAENARHWRALTRRKAPELSKTAMRELCNAAVESGAPIRKAPPPSSS